MIRQPIVSLLGHVDHGKTKLLDAIRGTTVQLGEAGGITQHIGASFIPIEVIRGICGHLLKELEVKLEVPGLLFIDTPGHEAFTTLRKRGGSVADLAVLVIDVNEGFQPQTDESLIFLKQFKTPFLVAATKVDLVPGWHPQKTTCFFDSFKEQRNDVKKDVEKKVYDIIAQLSEREFEAERFDRIEDFKKQISIIPCSGKTGEGIAELLVMLAGLAQRFLKDELKVSKKSRGTVLEVKEVRGLGTTIDAIVYDGLVKRGDYLVIGGKKPIVTKVKALLRPPSLRELRVEKKFERVKEVRAAAGIKIAAPNLEEVIAGSPIAFVSKKSKVESAKRTVQKEVEEVEFSRDVEGVIVKSDTIGGLEALIKMLGEKKIPIKKAEVGHVTKQDVIELEPVKDKLKKSILGFNVKVLSEAERLARDRGIKIFLNDIIYRLIEDYEEWHEERTKRKKEKKLEMVTRPCVIKVLPGFVFRKSGPAIFGVEILEGVLKTNAPMKREDGKSVGKVKQIQKRGENVKEVLAGDKVAISIEGVTIGRQIKEGDVLLTVITRHNLKGLKGIWDELRDDEKELLKEWELI